jgi:hypothetical protein
VSHVSDPSGLLLVSAGMGQAAALLAVLGLALLLEQAWGHGMMVRPPSRNWQAYLEKNFDYAHGLASGGAAAGMLCVLQQRPCPVCSRMQWLVLQVLGLCPTTGRGNGPGVARACAATPGIRTGAAPAMALAPPSHVAWYAAGCSCAHPATSAHRLDSQSSLQQLQQERTVY